MPRTGQILKKKRLFACPEHLQSSDRYDINTYAVPSTWSNMYFLIKGNKIWTKIWPYVQTIVNRKVQEVSQSEAAANPWHQVKETNDTN